MSSQGLKTAVALFIATTFSTTSYQACSAGPDTTPHAHRSAIKCPAHIVEAGCFLSDISTFI